MSARQLAQVIEEGHWVEETHGEYVDAWTSFWGKDIVPDTCAPHTAWTNGDTLTHLVDETGVYSWMLDITALKFKSRPAPSDKMLEDLAHNILEPARGSSALRPCSFIQSPWAKELCHTKGKIMLLDEFDRIYSQLQTSAQSNGDGAVIVGQRGVGT